MDLDHNGIRQLREGEPFTTEIKPGYNDRQRELNRQRIQDAIDVNQFLDTGTQYTEPEARI